MAAFTGTRSREFTFKSEVLKAEPDFEAQKRRELEYEFDNGVQFRKFTANRALRHPYNIED